MRAQRSVRNWTSPVPWMCTTMGERAELYRTKDPGGVPGGPGRQMAARWQALDFDSVVAARRLACP